jgi:branched-chain amino acid transport system ATP-binding protein
MEEGFGPDMEALKVTSLSMRFGGVQVLSDVSFLLSGGERLVIIGPNGAGKTTLFNLLNGQLFPVSGQIVLFGKDVTAMSTYHRALLGMSRSFQVTSLFPNLTVLDSFLLGHRGTNPNRIKMFRSMTMYKQLYRKAEEFLTVFELWEKKDALVKDMAYGEQRKLEILLCLASQPKLLLLDEPTCGLTSGESADLINKINDVGRDLPAIVVSHDMDLVYGIADRIIVLHQGKIIANGLPKDIAADSRVRRIYMGIEEEDAGSAGAA